MVTQAQEQVKTYSDDSSQQINIQKLIDKHTKEMAVSGNFLSWLRIELFASHLSRVVRKPAFCICEHKDADQLRGNREADQGLCFRYTDSTIPLLHKSEISSIQPSSVTVQPGLCRTWSETPKTGFLRTRLISELCLMFKILY